MAILSTSIARKFAMALSGLFLVLFLAQHLTINLSSVFDPETFNSWSEFMGTNIAVQFILQPILAFAVVFHFIMGFILEARNRNARKISYKSYKGNRNSTWVSRNMLISGLVILAFLGLHFYDFWFPEMNIKYIQGGPLDPTRYYTEMVHKFADPVRTALYCISFVLLALHLWHGFSSTFQSIGWNNKYSKGLRGFTQFYAVVVPLGFIFIALYLHFNGSF
ncbi:succinate dehydrogenase cytochrome b subunit [Aequorivita sp. H23M31]|uniref:Succinate dehydrogenase cytochrome b subunit n=1 Tax=Aequorivita ciconiae TaxID=2494375 RepID=A0A410G546_9FLAO|nr:succinate dehydrogenase cytochrome b subunit [Aequorivita sp. H23M31]QAA82392.1 succinate dehydrogenase cytochrome b subunit [Aequorivita sp. H23M31]